MKWIRESMTQIDLVDGEKKLAYIVYKNFRATFQAIRTQCHD